MPGTVPGKHEGASVTGGGHKAVYCHRWGRVRDAVGPSGGASGAQNKRPRVVSSPEGLLHDRADTSDQPQRRTARTDIKISFISEIPSLWKR